MALAYHCVSIYILSEDASVAGVCAYFPLPSFCWVLAATELRDRLTPRDRSDSIVSFAVITETEMLNTRRICSLLSSLSVLVDLKINQVKPSSTLFPGVPGDVMVHNGFRDAHSATASSILAEVKNLISTKGATSVVAVSSGLFE